MTSLRKLTPPVMGVLVAALLTGCSILSPTATAPTIVPPAKTAAPTVTATELNDTTWSGSDSAALPTTFIFHEDGSAAVAYGDNSYDDAGDTWELVGDILTVTIHNVEARGDATYVGLVSSAKDPIDLAVTFTANDEKRTLSISQ